jgi:multidrug efflux system outer membrane protein
MNCSARLIALSAALLLGACSSAPKLALFQPVLPASFANAPDAALALSAATGEPPARFWQGFNDPILDSLVQRALQANVDVRTAGARLDESRALGRYAEANLLPSIGASVGAARVRAKNDAGVPQTNKVYSAGFDVLWEADLFGRLGDARRAALANVRGGEAGVRAAQLSVAAEVASSYFQLRGLQEQLRVARASLETQSAALELVAKREEVGRGTALDTERARSLLKSTASDLPALESSLINTRYRLAVLCGVQPTALDAELGPVQALPGLAPVQLSNIGSPAQLLRRRPDIAQAEAQAAAAAAQVGVARSALFPTLTLGGTLGQNALSIGDLGKGVNYAYNLGAQLTWNLLDFGRIRAQIAAADARSAGVMALYEYTVLAALAETEGALADYTRRQQQAQLLFEATRSSEQAALIARERFKVGSTDFLTVLDAERELLSARNRLALAQTNAATSLVAVYKALAGGWQAP